MVGEEDIRRTANLPARADAPRSRASRLESITAPAAEYWLTVLD